MSATLAPPTIKEIQTNGVIKTVATGVAALRLTVDVSGDLFYTGFGTTVAEILADGTTKNVGSNFQFPAGVAVDAAGNLFVADAGNNLVKKVLPSGVIQNLGTTFNNPSGVAVDAAGNVYVADKGNNAVKEILTNGLVIAIGFGFNAPSDVAVDSAGNVFVVDAGNKAVKEILPSGGVRTLLTGLNMPISIAVDAAGSAFIADTAGTSIIKLSAPTVTAIPATLNTSTPTAISAALTGLAVGSTYHFRAVSQGIGGTGIGQTQSFFTGTAPTVTTNPAAQSLVPTQTATFTAAATGTPLPIVRWQVSIDGGATFADLVGATSTTLNFTATTSQNGYQYRAVFTNGAGTATTTPCDPDRLIDAHTPVRRLFRGDFRRHAERQHLRRHEHVSAGADHRLHRQCRNRDLRRRFGRHQSWNDQHQRLQRFHNHVRQHRAPGRAHG